MKKYCILLIFLGSNFLSIAQFSNIKLVGNENISTPRFIQTGDMDNDGDIDVIAPSFDRIVVFSNDENGSFGFPTIIIDELGVTQTHFVSDLNGDGFLDVLGTDFDVAMENFWVSNNGDGTYGDKMTIYTGARPYHIFAVDIDNDGDNDVLTNSGAQQELRLFKNTDGLGTFDSGANVNVGHTNGRSTGAADFDGDGDMDLASSGSGGTQLTWFENLEGLGNSWGIHEIQLEGNGVRSIYVVDMDGDGDADILKGVYIGNLAWHENIDGLGTFSAEKVIAPALDFMASVFAADLDNDGDMDVMSTHDTNASWWENLDGQGTFGSQQDFYTEFNFAIAIEAADLDNDGDNDVVVASQNDNAVYWFENFSILSSPEQFIELIEVYPNPVGDTLYFTSSKVGKYDVTITDALGRTLVSEKNSPGSINIAHLSSGTLFITISDGKYSTIKKAIKL
ncbi:T9SS type A sorting domain-containing protein [Jejudonia soesokkakensis]|uniref:T9SS type A sorting domain-containing protein n=1 Tax=Jejudonia soesokkakensis TaxID=1323432 RepID=A0ABW2MR65_9FLAO